MKKQIRMIISYMLLLSFIMTITLYVDFADLEAQTNAHELSTDEPESGADGGDFEDFEEEDIEKEVEISYKITDQRDKQYDLGVMLTNVTDEKIEDWEIRFPANFKIEKIWDAKVTEEQDGEYMIHNAEWNQDIPLKGSVSFGMTVIGDAPPKLPKYCEMVRLCLGVSDGFKVSYKEFKYWEGHVKGKIVIANNKDRTIEDWQLYLETSIKIQDIRNATIGRSFKLEDGNDGYSYELNNIKNNQNIKAGESVEIEFTAKRKGNVKIYTSQLFEMIEDDGEEDYDYEEDEGEDVLFDELSMDEDAFETSEEYVEYMKLAYIKKLSFYIMDFCEKFCLVLCF